METRLPPLNALRAFDAAGHRLNFRTAADDLGVTQGAVAQQVRLLESHLGMPLFDRLPKGLAFTPQGRSYHARVSSAFDDLRAATQTLRPEPDKVLVSVTPSFASKWLIPNLPAFTTAHPEIDLRILATEKVSSFHSDGIDIAIRQGHPPFGAAVDATRLFRPDIIAVAAPVLIAGHALPLTPETLAQLPKLHDAHDLWPAFFKTLTYRDQSGRGLRLSQTALAIDAAIAGQGVALAARFLVARDIAAGHLQQVIPQTLTNTQDVYLIAQRRPNRSAATEIVLNWFTAATTPDR